MLSLKEHYSNSVINELKQTLKLSTGMAVPKITKVTINMGVGEVITDKKVLENAVEDLTSISGQKPLITKVRKSVANFKIRDGIEVVTYIERGTHQRAPLYDTRPAGGMEEGVPNS